MGRRTRVLMGKPGLDGHRRGTMYLRRAHENIADAAMGENADFAGISLLSGGAVSPRQDIQGLMDAGYEAFFTSVTPPSQIVEFMNSRMEQRQ